MTTSRIRIGFSMHPRWIGTEELEAFLAPLRRVGLSALEFELDDRLENWAAFEPMMESAFGMGLMLSFHAPYRPPHSLAGFSTEQRAAIEDDLRPLLDIAAAWAKRSPECRTLVVHAASGKSSADQAALSADTAEFLTWLLSTYPNLQLALENNHPARSEEVKIGVEREEILALVGTVGHPRLGICWDLGHDVLRHQVQEPTPEWLSKVVHVHVHDIDDQGEDHFPLIFGRVPFKRWLHAWKAVALRGRIILELKGTHLQGWPPKQISQILGRSVAELAEVME